MLRSPMSARVASSEGRLAWMSVITASGTADQGTRRPFSPYDGGVSTDSIGDLRTAVKRAARNLRDGEPSGPEPSLERPPKPELGDYSSNAAMLLAAPLGEDPRDVAGRLGAELERELGEAGSVDRIEIAGPGFVNLFLADAWYASAM